MNSKDFIFVYDPKLAKHLKFNLEVNYITNALNKSTGSEFWLFPRTNEIRMGIREWKEKMNK